MTNIRASDSFALLSFQCEANDQSYVVVSSFVTWKTDLWTKMFGPPPAWCVCVCVCVRARAHDNWSLSAIKRTLSSLGWNERVFYLWARLPGHPRPHFVSILDSERITMTPHSIEKSPKNGKKFQKKTEMRSFARNKRTAYKCHGQLLIADFHNYWISLQHFSDLWIPLVLTQPVTPHYRTFRTYQSTGARVKWGQKMSGVLIRYTSWKRSGADLEQGGQITDSMELGQP